nr:leucine-rich repeat domain-containing protein [Clostridium beijerinckii]
MPSTVTTIGNSAFADRTLLTNVTLPFVEMTSLYQ